MAPTAAPKRAGAGPMSIVDSPGTRGAGGRGGGVPPLKSGLRKDRHYFVGGQKWRIVDQSLPPQIRTSDITGRSR